MDNTEAMFILTLHGIVLIGWFEDFLYLVTIGELCESLPYLGTGVYLARIYLGTGVYLARIYLG